MNLMTSDPHATPYWPSHACRSIFATIIVVHGAVSVAHGGGTIARIPVRDNTLFEYNPADAGSTLNSNGMGDFFSAGRTLNRNLIRRGLVKFDLSDIPGSARVVPGTARLELYVVSAPRQDASPRPFWVTPAMQPWGEGMSSINANISGAGNGVLAQAGDATWYHTHYDPPSHEGQPFQANGPGFWGALGGLSGSPIDTPSTYGSPFAIVASDVGPTALTGQSLEQDVNYWLSGVTPNHGWFVLGDETATGTALSSLRSFASREHANSAFRPTLRFDYVVADFTGDNAIDGADLAVMFLHWNTAHPTVDVTGDGLVDGADLAVLYGEWTGDGSVAPALLVPEPAGHVLLVLWGLMPAVRSRSGLARDADRSRSTTAAA